MNTINLLLNTSIVIVTFFFMEFMAWFTHKYVMHGPLWVLHKDHHQKEPGFFEKNDAFFLIFAIPSIILLSFGFATLDFRFWIGLGILIYGIAYFFVHDIFIHQRFRIFRKTNSAYLKALRKAHGVHHRHIRKEKGECFGMLVVPFKYIKEAMQAKSS